jgi:hypothetical protein
MSACACACVLRVRQASRIESHGYPMAIVVSDATRAHLTRPPQPAAAPHSPAAPFSAADSDLLPPPRAGSDGSIGAAGPDPGSVESLETGQRGGPGWELVECGPRAMKGKGLVNVHVLRHPRTAWAAAAAALTAGRAPRAELSAAGSGAGGVGVGMSRTRSSSSLRRAESKGRN